ncbi:MAG TPA: hypothetical protein VH597_04685 [Verrucomicrobiae bacterium]|jgi:hypothetical protein|nr:hypothetical protein [Verrucomicrobiae bacterium]
MNWGLFESFCEMLESIPIKAVLRAADAERKMVEEDLKRKRAEPDEGVISVLCFCNFLSLAMRGIHASLSALPFEHQAFYARIVQQLVDAGELPSGIKSHFERTFLPAPDKREALASAQSRTYGNNERFA